MVNLDPGNDLLPYECAVDVMELIRLEDAMEEFNLGPNGRTAAPPRRTFTPVYPVPVSASSSSMHPHPCLRACCSTRAVCNILPVRLRARWRGRGAGLLHGIHRAEP